MKTDPKDEVRRLVYEADKILADMLPRETGEAFEPIIKKAMGWMGEKCRQILREHPEFRYSDTLHEISGAFVALIDEVQDEL